MLERIAAAAALAVPGWAVLAGLASLRARVTGRRAAMDPAGRAEDRPATVNLVLNRCAANAGAYQATILDLAARGFLAAREDLGDLWIGRAQPPPGAPVLAGYEQQVLGDAQARLADTGGAPFPALADACTADPQGIWEPFAAKLMADTRQRGICRPVLPATARTAGQVTLAAAVIALLAFLIASSRPAAGLKSDGIAVGAAVGVFLFGVAILCGQTRLTPAGAALAARWKREAWADAPVMPVQRRAYAVAAGVPSVLSGLAVPAGGRPGRRLRHTRPGAKQRPAQAWSSFSGTWRPVAIGPAFGAAESPGSALALFAGAVVFGLVGFILTVPVEAGPLALIPAALAVLLGGMALSHLLRWSAKPGPSTFDGQVIARWQEDKSQGEDTVTVPYIAVDDGQRGWTFAGHDGVALGDLVQVTVSPRSGKSSLTVTASPRAVQAAAEPDEPAPLALLLTAPDAAALLGQVTGTMPLGTPGGSGVIHRGPGRRNLIFTVASGRLANLNAAYARKHGTPAGGVGDEAWVLYRGRYVTFRAGALVGKVHLTGPASVADPDLVLTLAATLAARLAAPADSPASGAEPRRY